MIKQYLDSEGLRKLIKHIITLNSEGDGISIETVDHHKVISVKYDGKTIILDSEGNLETAIGGWLELDSAGEIIHYVDNKFIKVDNETIIVNSEGALEAIGGVSIDGKTIIKNSEGKLETALGGWVEEGGTTTPVTIATFNAEPPAGSEAGTFVYAADVSKIPSGAMGFEAKFDAIITSHPYTKTVAFTRLFPRNVYQFADPMDPVTWTLDVDNSTLTAVFAGSLPVYPYIVGKLSIDVATDLIHTIDSKFIKINKGTLEIDSEGALNVIGGAASGIDGKTIILDSEGKMSTRLGGYKETVHILEHDVQMSSLGLPMISPLPTSMNAWNLLVDPATLVEGTTITLNIEADVNLDGTHYAINEPVDFTFTSGMWEGFYSSTIAGRGVQFAIDPSSVIGGTPIFIVAVEELHDSEGLVILTNLVTNNYHVTEHDEEVISYADGELLPIDAKTIVLNSEGELETALGGYITTQKTLIPEVLEPITGNGTPVIDKTSYKAWPYVYDPTPYAEDGVVTLRVHGIFADEEIDEYLEFTHIEDEELYRSDSFTVAGVNLKFELLDTGVGDDSCYLTREDPHDDLPSGYYDLYDLIYYVPEHYENVEVFHYADNRLIKVDNSTIFVNSEGALQAAGSANADEKTIITNSEGLIETQIGGWIEYTVPTYNTELLQVTGAPSGTHGDYDVYWRCNSNLNELRDEDSLNVHAKFSIDGDEFEKDLVLTNDRGTGNYYCNYVYISDSYPESHFYVQYQDGSVDERWCVEVMSPGRLTTMEFESFAVVRPVDMNEELVQNPGLPTGSWDTFDVYYQCNSNLNTFISELGDNLETTVHIEAGGIRGEELNQDVVLHRISSDYQSLGSDLIEIAGSSIEVGLWFGNSSDPEDWCIELYNDAGDLDLTTAEVWSLTYTRALEETIHPIDGRFIPVDGSTIVVNSEGKLSAAGGGSAINIDNWTIVHEDASDPTTPIRTAVGGGYREDGVYSATLFENSTFNYDDTKNIVTGTFDYEILDKLVDYWPESVYVNIDGVINVPGGVTKTFNYTDLELPISETSWPPHWVGETSDGYYKVFIGDDHGEACLSIVCLRGSYPSGTTFTLSSDFNAPYDELYEEINPAFMPIDHQTILGNESGGDYLRTAIGGWYEEEVERQLSYSRDRSTWDSEGSMLVFDGVSFLDDVNPEYTSQITISGTVTYPTSSRPGTLMFNNAPCNLTEVSYGAAAWVYNATDFSLEFVKNYNGVAWNYVALIKFTGSGIEYPTGESDNINLTGSYWQDEIYHPVEPRFLPIDNSTITINDDNKLVANIGALADGKTIIINSEGTKMYTALGGARYTETVTVPSYEVQLTSTGVGTPGGDVVYTWTYAKEIGSYVSTDTAQVHIVCKLNGNYTDQTFEFTKDTVAGMLCWVSPTITVDGVDGKFVLAIAAVGQADTACFMSADMTTALPTGEEYSIETFELIVPETTQEVERIDYADPDLIGFDRESIIVEDGVIKTAFGGWIIDAISIHDVLLDSEGGTEIGSNLYQWNLPNSSMAKVADRDEFLASFVGKVQIGGSWNEFHEQDFTLVKVSSEPNAWQTAIGGGAFKITITTNSEGSYILVGDGSLVPYPVTAAELTVKLKVDEAEQVGYGNSKMIEHDGTIIREGNVLKTAIGGWKEVTRDSTGLFVDTLGNGAHTYIGPGSDRYEVGWDYTQTITSLVSGATEAKIHVKLAVLGNTFEDDVVLVKQATIPVIWESDPFDIGDDSYYIAVHDQYVGANNGGITLNSRLTSLDLTGATMSACDLVGEYYTAYHKVDNSYIDIDEKSIKLDTFNKLAAKIDAKTIVISSEGLKVNTDNSTIINDSDRLFVPIDNQTIKVNSEGYVIATANNVIPDGITIKEDANDVISVPIDYRTIVLDSEGNLSTFTYSINGVNLATENGVTTEDAKITWYGTQAEFDALGSLNPYTMYVINNNSEGSVAEEQRSYSVLKDKPKINHVTLDGDKVPEEFGIQRLMSGGSGIRVANNTVSLRYMGDVLKVEEGTLYADTYDRERLNKMLAAAKNVIVVADDLPTTPTANTVYYIRTTDSEGKQTYNGILIDTNLNRIPLGNPNNYAILSAGDCIRIQNEAINVIKTTSIDADSTNSEVATGEAVYTFLMQGCTSSEGGKRGVVPAPAAGDYNKFLRGDGNWADPANMVYYAGSGIDATKMDAERTVAHSHIIVPGSIGSKTTTSGNTISLPWADYDTNGHITAAGTRDHNILTYRGASVSTDGTAGLVKAPLAGDGDYKKFLKGDGTWGNEAVFESATTTADGVEGLVPAPTWEDVLMNKFLSAGGGWGSLPTFWGCSSEDDGEAGCVLAPSAGDQDMFLSARGYWTPLSNTMKSTTWTINKPGIMGGTVTINYNAGVTTLSWKLTTYASATGTINLGTLTPGWYPNVDMVFNMLRESGTSYLSSTSYLKVKSDGDVDLVNAQTSNVLVGTCTFVTGSTGWTS